MAGVENILENNRHWVAEKNAQDPGFFKRLANGQQPKYLFIGCSDSRVPASGITGTGPGEMFVHRNIANLVVHSDMNLLSVLQYAVEVLGVKDIMVVGHFGCGGVAAAASNKQYGLIDNWLTPIRDVIRLHETELLRIKDDKQRLRRLVELNVIEQVRNLAKTNIIQNAMRSDDPPRLHGLVYDVADGVLKDMKVDSNYVMREMAHIYGTEAEEHEVTPAQETPAASQPGNANNAKAQKPEKEKQSLPSIAG
ncbi:carbonic anhydrase [Hymenobacter sp. BT770]|uniref:carbonic anhydrase n=1 Tax=Hymenobacter sp. BT770 TaxID=2886942 RepID=UPI001D0FD239|nr:carbonic anhydrase [Hymenobacter sp. BT770]MCC3152274.1 carbonic anhydrase [Hymenobacter sp. BT770]MDO3414087.1 carbonic anhydrase [Hymenobacter sp. BT770]